MIIAVSQRLHSVHVFFQQQLENIKSRTITIAQNVFSTITSPIRFFGRFIDREVYHYKSKRNTIPYMTSEAAKKYLPLVGLTATSYEKNDFSWSEPLVKIINPMTLKINPAGMQKNDHCLFDPTTGLKVYIATNSKNELIFCFGSSGSGGDKDVQGFKKFQMQTNQRWATFGSFLGFNPRMYEQAVEVVEAIKNDLQYADEKVVLTGHCLAGEVASYVSLRTRIKAVVFNSLPLGAGLQAKISNNSLKEAKKYITHLSAERDFTSDFYGIETVDKFFHFFGIRTPGNFGERYFINCPYSSILQKHGFILGTMMHHTGYNVRMKPSEIPQDEIERLK